MTRLTIHLEEPIFFERTQKNIGSKENPILKPKKSSLVLKYQIIINLIIRVNC